MLECCENPVHLCQFPTEILIFIFKFLSVKNLISCRGVCKRWREIFDDITDDNKLWLEHCKNDFPKTFQDAKKKSNSCDRWFELYRALSLWGRLADAEESRDEFCHSSQFVDQIEDSYILSKGVTAVHKRSSVRYYDISNMQATDRAAIVGKYARFVEHEDIIIVLSEHLHLRIIWKDNANPTNVTPNGLPDVVDCLIYRNIKHFRPFGRHLYFVNIDNEIFDCNLDDRSTVQLPRNHEETVTTVSLYNGVIHTLTAERKIYKFVDGQFVLLIDLEEVKDNLFHCLWQYEFIEHLNWRLFYFWMAHYRLMQPQSPLGYISMMKVYGDIFFIGCKNGVLLIYYKPYTNGMLDLFNHDPVKQYNFAEREDIPVLSLHPIISIDILEMKNGHKVVVGMPKKLIILTYEHSFEVIKSKAVIPYVPPGPFMVKKDDKI